MYDLLLAEVQQGCTLYKPNSERNDRIIVDRKRCNHFLPHEVNIIFIQRSWMKSDLHFWRWQRCIGLFSILLIFGLFFLVVTFQEGSLLEDVSEVPQAFSRKLTSNKDRFLTLG